MWPWLLLLLLVALAGGAIWWVLGRRRQHIRWQAELDAASTKAAWLAEEPVTAVVGAPSVDAMEQAWAEVSTVVGEVHAQLFELSGTAPDEVSRQRVADTRSSLDGLRGSLLELVEQTRGGAGADVQRQRTADVERARATLRASLAGPESSSNRRVT